MRMAFLNPRFIHIFRKDFGVGCPVHEGEQVPFRFCADPAEF